MSFRNSFKSLNKDKNIDLLKEFRFKQEVKQFEELKKKNKDHFLLAESAIDALEDLKKNSVDYVITDPPLVTLYSMQNYYICGEVG